MKKFLRVVALGCAVLLIPACACSDGYVRGWFGSSNYSACNQKCCDEVDPKPCGCSATCPCWRRHK
jgi:hypothetical protein